MSAPAPPLRFLMMVVGGWVCLRAAMLFPGFPETERRAAPPVQAAVATSSPAPSAPPIVGMPEGRRTSLPQSMAAPFPIPAHIAEGAGESFAPALPFIAGERPLAQRRFAPLAPPGPFLSAPPRLADAGVNRWSASAWLFVRRGAEAGALVPGGTLGGSQAGGRLLYRLNADSERPVSLSARFYTPLHEVSGSEASFGLEWQPVSGIPVRLLAERREALDRNGRSAFGLTVHGGVDGRPLPAGLRLDAYGQAGVVGLESRDLFADGAVRIGAETGPFQLGAAAWGAAQPGVSRLDIGPQASVRIPIDRANMRLSADWRFRIGGNAAPKSGLSVTLGADF